MCLVPQSGPEGKVWEFLHRHWSEPTCRTGLLRVLAGGDGAWAGAFQNSLWA